MVATRDGQFLSIASYAAGSGVAALTSVLVGGGTTLAFTTGDLRRQSAVRRVRVAVVLPVIGLATGIGAFAYSNLGVLSVPGVVAGGLATLFAVGAEIDASYMRRVLRTPSLVTIDILHRALAFFTILVGFDYAIAMLLGAIIRSISLRIVTRADPSRSPLKMSVEEIFRLAYDRKLTSLSILYALTDRVSSILAPLVAPVPVAGGYIATVSAQQNASGVIMNGVQTTLASRSQQNRKLVWANKVDMVFVTISFVAGIAIASAKDPLVELLGFDYSTQPEAYWIAVSFLIPASICSRVIDFRMLIGETPWVPVVSRAVATGVIGVSITFAYSSASVGILATGILLGEISSIVTATCLYLYFMHRQDRKAH